MNKLNIITDSFVSHYDKLRLEREFYELSIENLLHSGKCNYHFLTVAEENPEEFKRKTNEFRQRLNQLVDPPPKDYN